MSWNIVFIDNLENWLNQLDKQKLKSLAKELRLLELCGNKLKLPHSKPIGSNLFELRERNYGLRVYYSYEKNMTILLLCAGNKESQKNDIKKAKELLKQYRRGK